MSEAARKKEQARNKRLIPREQGEYVSVHYSAFGKLGKDGRALRPTEVVLLEMVNGLSLSQPQPRDGSPAPRMDRRTYKDLSAILHRDKSTIARSMYSLSGDALIKREHGSACMEYEGLQKLDGQYIVSEYWLYHTPFEIDGAKVYATNAQVRVLGDIMKHCLNPENKKRSYTAKAEEIAATLNLCEKTVRAAVNFWILVGFITRPKEDKGRRGKDSTYHLAEEFFGRKKREKKSLTPAQKAEAARKEEDKNREEKAERERYYTGLKAAADGKAEKALRRAMRNLAYKAAAAELAEAERAVAKAEAFHAPTLPELIKKAEELRRRKSAVISGMGMTEEDFVPQYRCKKCSDTGFLPDGRACGCYYLRE